MVLELVTSDGVLLRRDAVRAGYDDNLLARLVKRRVIVRIRQGAYAPASVWDGLDVEGRHRLCAAAVMLQYDDEVALSHASAALAWCGPSYGLDLRDVHLTHFEGGGRNGAGITHHEGSCRVDDITRRNDHWITSPARTVLDVATLLGLETGVVLGDDFVHRGLATVEQLHRLAQPMEFWPDTLTLRIVLELIDGRSESVGETLIRLLCRKMRLPRPELQWEVFGPQGELVGRSDFVWHEHKLMGEFDGKVKYLRFRRPGETIDEAVLREKRREDLMREITGYGMIRFDWADARAEQRTAARLDSQLRIVR